MIPCNAITPNGYLVIYTNIPARFRPTRAVEHIRRVILNNGNANTTVGAGGETSPADGLIVVNTDGTVWLYASIAKASFTSTRPTLRETTIDWFVSMS